MYRNRYKWVLFLSLSSLTAISYGRMMGGGMMDSEAAPPIPPNKNASPVVKKGYGLVQTYCVQCHQSPNPAQHTAAEWPGVLTRMQHYMQQQHRPVPTETDHKLILDYLTRPAR